MLVYLDGQQAVLYLSRMNPSLGRNFEALDPLEWLVRMSDHIPDPGQHRTIGASSVPGVQGGSHLPSCGVTSPASVMPLAAGSRLGPYEVLGPLGAGGMGEVYVARDSRIGREVAVKLLPASFADDPARLQRFEREARVAGSLNHPNLLTLFDVGTHGGAPYLVTELLEGTTLRALLAAGRLPVRKAVEYGVQIARGLAAAHEKGVVHRDVKPENLFVTRDGRVKVLDFGLAKPGRPKEAEEAHSQLSTATSPTESGVILGTAGYMSPEQVVGQPADERSDIFALGAVLFEMLSGRRAFKRDSQVETLNAILKEDPAEITVTGSLLPPAVEQIVRRCLEKEAAERFRSAHDVAIALEIANPAATTALPERGGYRLPLLAAAGLVLVGLLGWLYLSRTPRTELPGPMKFRTFTADGGWKDAPRLSPDGERVAYAWTGPSDDNWDVYVKGLGFGARPLRLTVDAARDGFPVWSPDGREIAFVRELETSAAIYSISSLGGQERKLADVPHPPRPLHGRVSLMGSLSWSPDGKWLVYSEKDSPEGPAHVVRLSPASLEKEVVTHPPPTSVGDSCPEVSPDGSRVAFFRGQPGDIWIQPLGGGEPRRLTSERFYWCCGLAWSPDGGDVIFAINRLFTNSGSLFRVSPAGGEPRPLLGGGEDSDRASIRGTRMVYAQFRTEQADIWRVAGRKATPEDRVPRPLIVSSESDLLPAYSPDGRRIAFTSSRSGTQEIWVCDGDGSNPTQVTHLGGRLGAGQWSPDGRSLLFVKDGLHVVDANGGSLRRLPHPSSQVCCVSWSRDGRFVYFAENRTGREQVWKMPSAGGEAVQVTQAGGVLARESWDGRFVYYTRRGPTGIWRIPVEGGEETEVVKGPLGGDYGFSAWALARSGIYYARTRRHPRAEDYSIHYLDFATNRETRIFEKRGPFRHFDLAVSPDEAWILYREQPHWQSELMLVENFR